MENPITDELHENNKLSLTWQNIISIAYYWFYIAILTWARERIYIHNILHNFFI